MAGGRNHQQRTCHHLKLISSRVTNDSPDNDINNSLKKTKKKVHHCDSSFTRPVVSVIERTTGE
jgi:uncharacterized FlaG/YvyC family protein